MLSAELECRLPAARQFNEHLTEKLGVEKRAVQLALGVVDTVTLTERIEAILRARVLAPGEVKRIHNPVHRNCSRANPFKLRIDEAHIEGGVVYHETPIAKKLEEGTGDIGKDRFV